MVKNSIKKKENGFVYIEYLFWCVTVHEILYLEENLLAAE